MKVKICGLTRPEDAALLGPLGAWAGGLVFVPQTPRALLLSRAVEVRAAIPKGVLAVGVFADQPRRFIEEAARACRLDVVQLHGRETPEDCAGFAVPVWKAIAPPFDAKTLSEYAVAGFLFEPARSASDRRSGRVIAAADQASLWKAAIQVSARGLKILAGGLNPENVAAAVQAARPDAVDVSSGVEIGPGVKDPAKLRAFFSAARAKAL